MVTIKLILIFVILINNSIAKINNDLLVEENIIDNDGNSSDKNPADVFDGVYGECVIYLSYSCIQNRTLLYLKEINNLDEVPVIGNYVKFVKIDPTSGQTDNTSSINVSKDLSSLIDDAVEQFFEHHKLRLHTLGRDVDVARTVDDFVGRKRRKGGGGGGGGDKGDGGKKKMMMMAMMCMKMKMMVMIPAMMGMMGMMSFKGMMFSMMSFMIAKMMLLMKLLEKKGGGQGGGGGDVGWSASSGGGGVGAWMPAGGGGGSSDGYGGPGGGYNAAGEWQSRSIPELLSHEVTPPEQPRIQAQPLISYVTPQVRYSNGDFNKHDVKKLNDDRLEEVRNKNEAKLRKKRNVNNEFGDDLMREEEDYKNEPNKNVNIEIVADSLDEKSQEELKSINLENLNNDEIREDEEILEKDKQSKSRRKRGIMDLISYISTILKKNIFQENYKQLYTYPKYRYVNGVKYVYYPQRVLNKFKHPKMVPMDSVKQIEEEKPMTIEDYNKGEIVDEALEGRMNRKKFQKVKDTVKDVVEDNPWE